MPSLILYLLIGGGLGASLGYFGKCTSGTCPLTSTWWRGAIYGAALGSIFYFASGKAGSSAVNASTANVTRISQDQFAAEVTQAASPVVVDFYAPWCGPCRALSPMLDELAAPFTNRVKFVKVNIDEAPELAQRFKIQGIPTLIFFRDGQPADRLIGVPPAETLKARLASLAVAGASAEARP